MANEAEIRLLKEILALDDLQLRNAPTLRANNQKSYAQKMERKTVFASLIERLEAEDLLPPAPKNKGGRPRKDVQEAVKDMVSDAVTT